MKKTFKYAASILGLALAFTAVGCGTQLQFTEYNPSKNPGGDQFGADGNYKQPELTIDGKGDDAQWSGVETLAIFGRNNTAAQVKIYRGNDALFFFFDVKDNVLLTHGTANDDSVTESDSIELYLDTQADGGEKPQTDDYQINLAIHGKTRILQGSGAGWQPWNGLIDYEVVLDGTLNDGAEANDVGYTVEAMVPYSQINISKDDTIAIRFGQVDKVGTGRIVWTEGAADGTWDWNWYPWLYKSIIPDPQVPENYILLDKDNNLFTRDEEVKENVAIAGYVVDSVSKAPVVGASVSTTIDKKTVTTTTDDQGYYVFADVNPESNYTVLITKDGYFETSVEYLRNELRNANGGRVVKTAEARNFDSVAKTTITGTIKNLVEGVVGGATVTAEGAVVDGEIIKTVAAEDGTFTLEGVPADGNVTLLIEKAGYGVSRTKLERGDLVTDGDKITAVGDVNINLNPAQTGPFATGANKGINILKFANSSATVARALTGIEFYFRGTRQLSGRIEVYFDTGSTEVGRVRENDPDCWRFDLNGDGTIEGDHYAGGGFTSKGLQFDVYKNNDTGYEMRFFIPYTYAGIQPFEVFGISLGQWSTTASDWDGWDYNGAFVKPETPNTYLRLNAINQFYRYDDNTSLVDLYGNAQMEGVTVTAGGKSTVSAIDGSWSMKVPATQDALDVVFTMQGYDPVTKTIEAGYFATNYSCEVNASLSTHTVSINGTVTDSATNAAIEGVTVSLSISELTAITNAMGSYSFASIDTKNEIRITFTKEGYAERSVTISSAELAENNEITVDISLTPDAQIKTLIASGKVENINGAVAGATVSIQGTDITTTTDVDGNFAFDAFEVKDCVIVIEKSGYMTQTINFAQGSVAADATSVNLGKLDLWLEYASLGGNFANKNPAFAAFSAYVTRSMTGLEFKFVGTRGFYGTLELFMDTKDSSGDRNATDYRFDLTSTGLVRIENWGGSNTIVPADMKYTLTDASTLPTLLFTVPYSFLGIQATDVVGISLGQAVTGDWDGWAIDTMPGANGLPFVAPEIPWDYIRISANNQVFNNVCNLPTSEIDTNAYNVHFGSAMNANYDGTNYGNGDGFHAKVSRNATGVTFDFVTFGDFSQNEVSGTNEIVLLYLDTGTVSAGGWGADFLIKIDSDGSVYCNTSSWYKAADSNKIGTIEILRENGVTTFSLTIEYSTIGITANEVFGFALFEGWHNGNDNFAYSYANDCFLGLNGPQRVADAADSAAYIRVAASGLLYKATNNL